MATPIWDRQEISSTVAQYRGTDYEASLEAFDKRIVEAVQKGHPPEMIARSSSATPSDSSEMANSYRREDTAIHLNKIWMAMNLTHRHLHALQLPA